MSDPEFGPGRRVIVCVNARFCPPTREGPHLVGASQFVVHVVEVLARQARLAGVIMYRRDESLESPRCMAARYLTHPAVRLDFHFRMPRASIRRAFAEAAGRLDARNALVYLQTDALLFATAGTPTVVTHHGPFVDQLVDSVGLQLASRAFGSHEKLAHLRSHQRESLDEMRARRDTYALEISRMQAHYAIEHNVPSDRVFRIPPPLFAPTAGMVTRAVREIVSFATNGEGLGPTLVVAAARLDEFKNISLLVRASNALHSAGLYHRLVVIGGSGQAQEQKERLERELGPRLGAFALFAPSLPRGELLTCFAELAGKAVFVCTSRFETCGFTPLEAATQGLLTVMPNLVGHVEASRYFPEHLRFEPTSFELAAFLRALFERFDCSSESAPLRDALRDELSLVAFERELLRVIDDVGHAAAGR